ncbi:uncharacterized protein LTR77_010803 [Saxophila tyrrhenica]|uniref:Integral membrane protein n=1 Tax=Saxophila tyrrhenica TaxID=1690608 RepID=A0AAV9NU83_9PEZI|nr:hypothetical protein LTR77_010803 [Saxophila tyrrhenica]
MANQTVLDTITLETIPKSWQSDCIAQLNSTAYDWTHGLVGGHGQALSGLTNATWGITIETCEKYCNHIKIPFVFDFQSFSSSMTNYFLPWLALTAQLPFETGDFLTNAMAFCMAVGSPALVTFSLSITILNRYWVRKEFDDLQTKARSPTVRSRYEIFSDRVQACRLILQEAQQVPLRVCQSRGYFSSLIVLPENAAWWERVERRLKSTRRNVTASLVAQMAFAGIAYLFTVIASFQADLGDPATALQIASGSIWIWLQIPIIAGWITVGTQYSHHSIEDALRAEPAFRALQPPVQHGAELSDPDEQAGLVVQPGLNPLPHNHQTAHGGFDVADIRRLELPTWLGAEVGGDERLKGPIFNYARLFTWWQLASSIDHALFETMENVTRGVICARTPPPTLPGKWTAESHLRGDSGEVATYCNLNINSSILAYPEWSTIPSKVYKRIFEAMFVALFLQWGTTGASIMIAYLTPTTGLGCRSGSYLLYGVLGTSSWLLLLVSMLLSHEVMLRYQIEHHNNPTTDFRRHPDPGARTYVRTWSHSTLCGLAVVLRVFGKFLAIANTLFLLATSLMEFVGGFNNCWCMGNWIGMGNEGWIVLFKGADALSAAASLPWGGGLALALLVCFLSYTFFFFGSLKTDDDQFSKKILTILVRWCLGMGI